MDNFDGFNSFDQGSLDFQDILITRRITDDFLRNQGLKKIWTAKYLWALGTGTVLLGFYTQWQVPSGVINPFSFLSAIGGVSLIYFVYLLLVAKLSIHFPYAGGSYAYARRGLGNFAGYLAGTAVVFQFVCGAAAIFHLFNDYIIILIPGYLSFIIVGLIMVVLMVFYVLDTGISARVQFFLTVCGVSGLILFFIGCTENPGPVPILRYSDFSFWQGVYTALPLVFWYFMGLENLSVVAEETSNPKNMLPLALVVTLGTVVIISLSLWFFATHLMAGFYFQSNGHPLLFILQKIQSQDRVLISTFTAVSLCPYISALNGSINGFSRQIYSLARGGYYPLFLSRLSTTYRTPYIAIIIPGMAVLICALLFSLEFLVYFSLISAVSGHLLVLLSYYYIHKYEPALFRYPRFLNFILCTAFLLILMILFILLFACGRGIINMLFIWLLVCVYYLLWAKHHVRDEAPEESNAVSREKKIKIELK